MKSDIEYRLLIDLIDTCSYFEQILLSIEKSNSQSDTNKLVQINPESDSWLSFRIKADAFFDGFDADQDMIEIGHKYDLIIQGTLSSIDFSVVTRLKTLLISITDYYNCENDEPFSIDLPHELVTVCALLSDNPSNYQQFDEDQLNCEIRNLLTTSLSRYGYSICDHTKQGSSETEKKSGEIDLQIRKDSIPVAVIESLIHKDNQYLYDHVNKAISRYNYSGCQSVFVIEFSKTKRYDSVWNSAIMNLTKCDYLNVENKETGLSGIKMLAGKYLYLGREGDFNYIAVNMSK